MRRAAFEQSASQFGMVLGCTFFCTTDNPNLGFLLRWLVCLLEPVLSEGHGSMEVDAWLSSHPRFCPTIWHKRGGVGQLVFQCLLRCSVAQIGVVGKGIYF